MKYLKSFTAMSSWSRAIGSVRLMYEIALLTSIVLFVACGDDSSSSPKVILPSEVENADELKSYECNMSVIGEKVFVESEEKNYECDGDHWFESFDTGKLSSSSKKNGEAGTESDMTSSSGKSSSSKKSSSSVSPSSSSWSSKAAIGSSSSSAKTSSSSSFPEGVVDPSTVVMGTLTDERDGKIYKTVKIGEQVWMAENLNYAYTDVPYTSNTGYYKSDSTSWCYNNSTEYCSQYGRLYTWAAAMDSVGTWSESGKGCGFGSTECTPTLPVRGICPEGWHLPTKTEWETLFTSVGGESTAGKMLKTKGGWMGDGGTDAYSFSARSAGVRFYSTGFGSLPTNTYFWSSTEFNSYNAYYIGLSYANGKVNLSFDFMGYGNSVRCVKD